MYNTAGTNLLCAILKRKTGKHLTEFLRPRLIEPLGMSDIRCQAAGRYGNGRSRVFPSTTRGHGTVHPVCSQSGPMGRKNSCFGRSGSRLPPPSKSKIGVGWGGDPDWQQGYCFQFWRCEPRACSAETELLANTASIHGTGRRAGDHLRLYAPAGCFDLCVEKLLPGMQAEPLPEDRMNCHVLAHRLRNLNSLPCLACGIPERRNPSTGPSTCLTPPTPSLTDLIGGIGKFQPDGGTLQELHLIFAGNSDVRLQCVQDNGCCELKIGMEGHHVLTQLDGVLYGAIGRWRAVDKLELSCAIPAWRGASDLCCSFRVTS